MALLELDDVHTYYGAIHALRGVSLTVDEGEIVTLIGANGAGKSTTLRTISGQLRLRQGEIKLRGERIDHRRPHEIVELGRLPVARGSPGLQPDVRPGEPRDGRLPAQGQGGHRSRLRACVRRCSRGSRSASKQKAGHAVRRRAADARHRPRADGPAKLLLLDEPSMGLAPILVEQIFDIIGEINAQGTTVLLVEQNALMALAIANRGYILQTGEIVLSDAAATLAKNPAVRAAYLGGD